LPVPPDVEQVRVVPVAVLTIENVLPDFDVPVTV
jgi:hypothetical protein